MGTYTPNFNLYKPAVDEEGWAVLVDDNWDNISSEVAPKDSPALTGTPTTPTAAPGTDTTQIASTEFVQDAVGSSVFQFTQSSPAATWTVPHNLGLAPLSVVVMDSTNTEVFVEKHFDSNNQVSIKFSAPTSGVVTCSV